MIENGTGHDSTQVNQKLWHKLIRSAYTIDACMFELSPQQVKKLLQSESHQQLNSILTQQQNQLINSTIAASPHHALFPKVNGRTPKDLPYINRQIRKISDFIDILHSSEYVLQALHEDKVNYVVLRHFMKQLTEGTSIYEVFVRRGFVLAIAQKYCDHVQLHIEQESVLQIIEVIQEIMPAVTLICPKGNGHQLNSFVASIYCKNSVIKVTSILPYPPFPKQAHCTVGQKEFQDYYKDIVEGKKHLSAQKKFQNNQGVMPLLKTVAKQSQIKHYDMGQYLIGNEIDNEEKMAQWKQFIKEARQKVQDD